MAGVATDPFKLAVAAAAVAQGAVISLHSAEPDATGSHELTTSPYARKTTVWGTPQMGSGAHAGKAEATGSVQTFDVAAGDAPTHFGVRATDGTFLWGDALDPPLTAQATAGTVEVTPIYRYTHR
jgi:hypothetical protein